MGCLISTGGSRIDIHCISAAHSWCSGFIHTYLFAGGSSAELWCTHATQQDIEILVRAGGFAPLFQLILAPMYTGVYIH